MDTALARTITAERVAVLDRRLRRLAEQTTEARRERDALVVLLNGTPPTER